MPTAVYDASYLTFRKQAKALYAFNAAVEAARNNGTGTVRTEQPTTQMASVILTRKQGGCFCTNDAAGLSITRQGPGACGNCDN
jgi:hypothetical protein